MFKQLQLIIKVGIDCDICRSVDELSEYLFQFDCYIFYIIGCSRHKHRSKSKALNTKIIYNNFYFHKYKEITQYILLNYYKAYEYKIKNEVNKK